MTIFVALSGGVDSAAAAILLKEQGYDVCGVHMQNWDVEVNEEVSGKGVQGCSANEDLKYVSEICEKLNIPLYTYAFVPEYWELVFEDYLADLNRNLNTNPDVTCNSRIKFGVLLKALEADFGPDIKLATGHWAKVIEDDHRYFLGVCNNDHKDQTYFLSSLSEYQLSKAIFPLSDISSKAEVRDLVRKYGFSNWDKRDSVGICFIGKRNYRDFVSKYIPEKTGNLIDIETGRILGTHNGVHLYVLHQRSGLFLKGYDEKYYVCGKDVQRNEILLCRESRLGDFLHKDTSVCKGINWINGTSAINDLIYIKTRHSPSFLRAKILFLDADICVLSHERGYITSPGQRIAFYDENRKICLGGGMYIGDDDDGQYLKK